MTASGTQVKGMQNGNCTLKIVGKYYMRLYAKKHFTNCPCSSFSSSSSSSSSSG